MSIPTAWLDQLRDRTTLSALIQRTTPLKRAGREWKACCPFHQEKSPSFTVNDEKGFYHCFGCNSHGDAIRWLTEHEGLPFMEAVAELALAAGMEVPAPDPRAAERESARNGDLDVMERAAARFAGSLHAPAGHAGLGYLLKRGITEGEIARFGIGFAPGTRMGEKPFIAEIGAPAEQLAALGLVKHNAEAGTTYDFFRRRVIIPIHDARGRCIGFGGRIVGEGDPKYLNSPDTRVFDKGRTLFNLHRAAPAARAKGRLVIVEGYFDVVGLASAGIDEAVAPNGTALTESQLAIAWRLVDVPIICLDGDKAGRKAALRAARRALPLLQPGKGLAFVFPPEGQDPDDVARAGGGEAISAMLSSRYSIVDVIWQEALERLRAAKGQTEATSGVRRDLRDILAQVKDADVRESFANEFQSRMANWSKQATTTRHRTAPARVAVREALHDAIVKGVVRFVGRVPDLWEDLARIQWTRPEIKRIIDALLWFADEGDALTSDNLVEALERRGLGDDYRVVMARETLRLPFLAGDDDAAFTSLYETIRAAAHT